MHDDGVASGAAGRTGKHTSSFVSWLGTTGLAIAALAAAALAPACAWAGCCAVVKIDPETPAVPIRACEPDAAGACGALLFEETLSLGASRSVCVPGETLVYQESDPATGTWRPAVTAICEGGDVEL